MDEPAATPPLKAETVNAAASVGAEPASRTDSPVATGGMAIDTTPRSVITITAVTGLAESGISSSEDEAGRQRAGDERRDRPAVGEATDAVRADHRTDAEADEDQRHELERDAGPLGEQRRDEAERAHAPAHDQDGAPRARATGGRSAAPAARSGRTPPRRSPRRA